MPRQTYEQLKNYVARKAAGKLSSVRIGGNIVVYRKYYDEDGVLLPDLKVIATTNITELNSRLDELQKEKVIINNFIAAENL